MPWERKDEGQLSSRADTETMGAEPIFHLGADDIPSSRVNTLAAHANQLEDKTLSMREMLDRGIAKKAEDAMITAPWYILRPSSRFCSIWDYVTAAALFFTAIVTPFEVAFLDEVESPANWLWIMNRFVDVIFFGDIFLSFFVRLQGC